MRTVETSIRAGWVTVAAERSTTVRPPEASRHAMIERAIKAAICRGSRDSVLQGRKVGPNSLPSPLCGGEGGGADKRSGECGAEFELLVAGSELAYTRHVAPCCEQAGCALARPTRRPGRLSLPWDPKNIGWPAA